MSSKSIEQMEEKRQIKKALEMEQRTAMELAQREREQRKEEKEEVSGSFKYRNETRVMPVPEDSGVRSKTPPVVTAKDIWDFDGSAVITSKTVGRSHGDTHAFVFPNTDIKYLSDIELVSKEVGPDRLLLLVNPFWKDVESWGFNILAPNGKKRAKEVIFDKGMVVNSI